MTHLRLKQFLFGSIFLFLLISCAGVGFKQISLKENTSKSASQDNPYVIWLYYQNKSFYNYLSFYPQAGTSFSPVTYQTGDIVLHAHLPSNVNCGAAVSFSSIDLTSHKNTAEIYIEYFADDEHNDFKVVAVDGGGDGKRVELEFRAAYYRKKLGDKHYEVRIPVKDFPKEGMYWNGERSVTDQFDVKDVAELRFSVANKRIESDIYVKTIGFILYNKPTSVDGHQLLVNDTKDGKYFGIFVKDSPRNFQNIVQLEHSLGTKMGIIAWEMNFPEKVNAAFIKDLYDKGYLSIITLKPLYYTSIKTVTFSDIASGSYDHVIEGLAEALKELDIPLMIQFAPSTNILGGPWSLSKDQAGSYQEAYKKIIDKFREKGADQIKFAFNIGLDEIFNESLISDSLSYYPGDGYIDFIALSLKNTSRNDFESIFDPYYQGLVSSYSKPMLFNQISTMFPGRRDAFWIKQLELIHTKYMQIKAFIWEQSGDEIYDFRIESSFQSIDGFKSLLANDWMSSKGLELLK